MADWVLHFQVFDSFGDDFVILILVIVFIMSRDETLF